VRASPTSLLAFVLVACSPSAEKTGEKREPKAESAEPEKTPKDPDGLELPPVDVKGATAVAEALPMAQPDIRGVMAATALAEIEKERLPGPFLEGLEAIGQAPPDQRSMLLAKALSESLPMLNHLCENGIALMKSLAEMAPEQRGPAIFDGCEMQAHGLVTREQMASRDPMMVLMGHLVFDHLSRGGELHAGERAAIEAMVGTSAPAPEPVPDP
jgi:hypothetical protein